MKATKRKKRTTTISAAMCCEATGDGIQFTEWRGDTRHVVRLDFDGSPSTAAYVIEQALAWIRLRRELVEASLAGIDFDLKNAKGES